MGGERERCLTVVLVNRTRTKFPRSLINIPDLLEQCARAEKRRGTWLPGWRVRCVAFEFGAMGVAADVRAARAADVLVGTHGAGLTNSFYMRRGSSLVEVRPYGFEGAWPDGYFRALTSLEQAVHYWQVSSGDAALSVPPPPEKVSVWDARDHAVRLPWRTLHELLQAIIECNGTHALYLRRLWARGTTFISRAAGT